MRILIVTTGLSVGGAEVMLAKVLEKIDRRRFSPSVISLTTLGEIGPRIAGSGIRVDALGMRAGLPDPLALFRLTRRIREQKPDAVCTWMYHADLIGGLAARLAGIKAIGWNIRNSYLDRTRTRWTTRAIVALCAVLSGWLPRRILSCSEAALRIHAKLGYAADKFVVIPNGFDLSRFKPDDESRRAVRAELGLTSDTPLIGMIGRFDPQKNHAGFLESAKEVLRRTPRVHFVLAGRGIDGNNAALTQWIDQAGLGNRTHLLGLRDDMPRLMAALDVLASSSSYGEAFPNVLGEAMACGVPCAVTAVGDSPFIVGDTGRVVAPGDMAGLADAMAALLSLPDQDRAKLGRQARARVESRFEIGQVVRQYEDFFESLCRFTMKGN